MSKININTTQKYLDKINKRTSLLSKPLQDDNKNKTEFIFFSIQNVNFAIPSNYAVEVISNFSLQEFQFLPKFLKGLINVRGTVIPVNDLSLLIFDKPLKNSYEIIRIKYKNIDTTFAIDEVKTTDVVINNSIIGNSEYRYIKSAIRNTDGTLTYILNLQDFFSSEKIMIKE